MAKPGYVFLHQRGELKGRAELLKEMYHSCSLCPFACGVDRVAGEAGRCRAGPNPVSAAVVRHEGEEPPLAVRGGIGNLFFRGCCLRCVYCQNHRISQGYFKAEAEEINDGELAKIFLKLDRESAPAIGLVTPTHFIPSIVEALEIAAEQGLELPIIFNTSSYESVEVLKLLDGIVDVYLADLRYASEEKARLYSRAPDYVRVAREAIQEMHRQVGDLQLNSEGLAIRGLVIRFLVLPEGTGGCEESLLWLRDALGTEVTLSLMAQYYPTFRVGHEKRFTAMNRRITPKEYYRVVERAEELGFENGWIQDLDSHESWRPESFLR
jgi:putative pyruvate formate lyase activating enzyme